MVIYFLSALLISLSVYKLGAYAMLISVIVTAMKVFMALVALVISILLWRRCRAKQRSTRINAAS